MLGKKCVKCLIYNIVMLQISFHQNKYLNFLKEITKKMSKISEPGYLFIHSGVLEKEQIEKSLSDCQEYLTKNYDKDFTTSSFEVNVVKNKDGKKFGHTYAWIEDLHLFNALIGLDFDGTQLVEMKDDENWEPPEKSLDEAMAEAGDDWCSWDDVEESYKRPKIKIQLEPLVTLPAIKYTPAQLKEINHESDFGFMEILPIKITQRIGKLNVLFTNDIPEWVTVESLFTYFHKFEKDKLKHQDKKSKKHYQYPVVKIKSKKDFRGFRRFGTITFSPLHTNTVSFLINVVKRVDFTNGKNSALLFFSQSKSKDN